jgi:hypothetical protein
MLGYYNFAGKKTIRWQKSIHLNQRLEAAEQILPVDEVNHLQMLRVQPEQEAVSTASIMGILAGRQISNAVGVTSM